MPFLTEPEQALARAMLRAAKVPSHDLDWMVMSCPSLSRLREVFGKGRAR